MTGRDFAAALQRLLVIVVLVASGSYLLVYLYRWEWNRALISGLVFVAAEIALSTTLVLHRLARTAEPDPRFDLALSRLREANLDRRHPFAWLRPRDDLGVFIPVLLGAGVVLSALAYVVERIAQATAHVTVDRTLARRLGALAPARPNAIPIPVRTFDRRQPRRSVVAGVVAAVVIVGLGIQVLAEATQSRPDDTDRPARSTIVLDVEQRTNGPVSDTAAALWVACRPVLPASTRSLARIAVDGARVELRLEPGIRDLATRRLTGCLTDATLSGVQADVVRVAHTP